VETRGSVMEEITDHVATTGDQLVEDEQWLETGGSFGARVDRKETTSSLGSTTPVFDKEPPPFPGKSLQHTLFQPSLGEEVFEGCFGDFSKFFPSEHCTQKEEYHPPSALKKILLSIGSHRQKVVLSFLHPVPVRRTLEVE
jgi:hypothetical protein